MSENIERINNNSKQKFVIEPGGKIIIEWVNPDFSDVIVDAVYSEEEKQQFLKHAGPNPKIWCG